MKKLAGLFIGLLLGLTSFGQTVEFTDAGPGYDKTATTEFNFDFSEHFSIDDINTTAANYASYFTVATTANASGVSCKVTLVEDTEMSRRVVSRLLISLGLQNVTAEGSSVGMNEFMETYIML